MHERDRQRNPHPADQQPETPDQAKERQKSERERRSTTDRPDGTQGIDGE